ncbi:hypothetical protein E4U43_001770 [Claviceps pusilla]|uniref:Uncharacterized protein n=1 Tax=Claviceps pusilla TaxID=123648 RepID=A0A9P7NJF3_9HYPO|nr:hypothetical protein E4U43_001770 [Claviceps pusilla]
MSGNAFDKENRKIVAANSEVGGARTNQIWAIDKGAGAKSSVVGFLPCLTAACTAENSTSREFVSFAAIYLAYRLPVSGKT